MSQEQAATTRVLAALAARFLYLNRHNAIQGTPAYARAQARISAWRRIA
jgi:hypothetical protein